MGLPGPSGLSIESLVIGSITAEVVCTDDGGNLMVDSVTEGHDNPVRFNTNPRTNFIRVRVWLNIDILPVLKNGDSKRFTAERQQAGLLSAPRLCLTSGDAPSRRPECFGQH